MDTQFLYLDESGDSGWPQGYGGSSKTRYFIYAGVILTPEENYQVKHNLNEIINDHFDKWQHTQPEEVHYAAAVHGNGLFGQLTNDELKDFRGDLFDLITDVEPTLMATVVDKQRMKGRYGEDAYPPKRYALRATVGRFHKHLEEHATVGSITIDTAEDTFDRKLRGLVYEAQKFGIKLPGAATSKDSTLPRLMDTVTLSPSEMSPGIQLADVVAYQVHNEFQHGGSYGFEAIEHLFRDPDGSYFTEPSVVPKKR